MAPEYGATTDFFGIDDKTIDYMRLTGRSEENIALVEAYAEGAGACGSSMARRTPCSPTRPDSTCRPSSRRSAGPKRPQDRASLPDVDDVFNADMAESITRRRRACSRGKDFDIGDGDVTIAAITSCTNTSNPGVLVAAGLVAKKADELGLKPKPWVKTSLAPGSQVVTDYLEKAGLQASRQYRLQHPASVMAAPPVSATRVRSLTGIRRRSTRMASSPRRSSRATATSKAACRPTCASSSPLRRSSSPMRSRAR